MCVYHALTAFVPRGTEDSWCGQSTEGQDLSWEENWEMTNKWDFCSSIRLERNNGDRATFPLNTFAKL